MITLTYNFENFFNMIIKTLCFQSGRLWKLDTITKDTAVTQIFLPLFEMSFKVSIVRDWDLY